MVGPEWLRLISLAWKINKLYTFSSLVFYLIPMDNLFMNICESLLFFIILKNKFIC